MIRRLHPIAGAIALLMILSFWLSTLVSEVFGSPAKIAMVKSLIPYGFLILIPALAAAGLSGARFEKAWKGPVAARKQKRMAVIAANGILVLVPSAMFLASKAKAGSFYTAFYAVQLVEVLAGAVKITLLDLNMRDGLRLTEKRRRKSA